MTRATRLQRGGGIRKASMRTFCPQEYKVVSLRECPLPDTMNECTQPAQVAAYWRTHIPSSPAYNPDVECFVVLLLTTRRRVKGHVLISTGTLDSTMVHPREVFRPAIVAAASAVVLAHHPSGGPQPSEADIRTTRELIRAGQLLRIDVLDHVIMGAGEAFCSLRELGYFYS